MNSGKFVRIQRLCDELASLQAQEDEITLDRASGGVRGFVRRGFNAITERLKGSRARRRR